MAEHEILSALASLYDGAEGWRGGSLLFAKKAR